MWGGWKMENVEVFFGIFFDMNNFFDTCSVYLYPSNKHYQNQPEVWHLPQRGISCWYVFPCRWDHHYLCRQAQRWHQLFQLCIFFPGKAIISFLFKRPSLLVPVFLRAVLTSLGCLKLFLSLKTTFDVERPMRAMTSSRVILLSTSTSLMLKIALTSAPGWYCLYLLRAAVRLGFPRVSPFVSTKSAQASNNTRKLLTWLGLN